MNGDKNAIHGKRLHRAIKRSNKVQVDEQNDNLNKQYDATLFELRYDFYIEHIFEIGERVIRQNKQLAFFVVV